MIKAFSLVLFIILEDNEKNPNYVLNEDFKYIEINNKFWKIFFLR
jgi:hypothetical protein